MNCPVKDETYLCETPCMMDKCPYQEGAKEFAMWLLHNSMLCDSLGQDLNDNDLLSESEIIDKVLSEWQKGEK